MLTSDSLANHRLPWPEIKVGLKNWLMSLVYNYNNLTTESDVTATLHPIIHCDL